MGEPKDSSNVWSEEGPHAVASSGVFKVSEHQSERPEQRPEAWSHCTKNYDVFAEGVTHPFAEDAVRLVRLDHSSRVLDVAAGTGAFAVAAARRGAQVLAVDFSSEMVGEVRQKCARLGLARVAAEVMDGQELQLADGSFDVVASLFGLMFFPDHERGLREMLRVLKPGGRAVIATWAPPARVEMMRLVGDAMMGAMLDGPDAEEAPLWTALSDPRQLNKQLRAAGFSAVHVVSVAHVWTFERPQVLAEVLPLATPSAAALIAGLSDAQRAAFERALIDGLRERQGDGPYAVANEGQIAVATKSA